MTNGLKTARALDCVCLCAAAAATAACSKETPAADGVASAAASAAVGANGEKYPGAALAVVLQDAEVGRRSDAGGAALVRNQSGLQGKGMGILQEGETVLIVADDDADPMVLEAIKRALEERKVTPHIKFTLRDARRVTKEAGRRPTASAAQGPGHQGGRHLPGDRLDHRAVPRSRGAEGVAEAERRPDLTRSSSRARRRAGPPRRREASGERPRPTGGEDAETGRRGEQAAATTAALRRRRRRSRTS